MIRRLLDLLFPPKCVLCGSVLGENETDLCHQCRIEVPECSAGGRKVPFLDSWVAVWYYEDPVRRSILRFKFHGKPGYADCYGRVLAMKILREYPGGFDMLAWVPVSRLRRLRRGYDQVELLANAVGAELGMDPIPVLKKIRNNRPQSGIAGDAQRRANVLGAYVVTEPALVKGKRILLLDDVITTGATVGECARVLLTAGAAEVHCGAVAVVRRKGKQSR